MFGCGKNSLNLFGSINILGLFSQNKSVTIKRHSIYKLNAVFQQNGLSLEHIKRAAAERLAYFFVQNNFLNAKIHENKVFITINYFGNELKSPTNE